MATELTPILIGTPPRTRAFFIKYVDLNENTPNGESLLEVQASLQNCEAVLAALMRDAYIQFEGPTGLVHFKFGSYIGAEITPIDDAFVVAARFEQGTLIAAG